jgi:hypothetical protein
MEKDCVNPSFTVSYRDSAASAATLRSARSAVGNSE